MHHHGGKASRSAEIHIGAVGFKSREKLAQRGELRRGCGGTRVIDLWFCEPRAIRQHGEAHWALWGQKQAGRLERHKVWNQLPECRGQGPMSRLVSFQCDGDFPHMRGGCQLRRPHRGTRPPRRKKQSQPNKRRKKPEPKADRDGGARRLQANFLSWGPGQGVIDRVAKPFLSRDVEAKEGGVGGWDAMLVLSAYSVPSRSRRAIP